MSGDFVPVYYQPHYKVGALRIKSDHLIIHLFNYCIDEFVVIFYGAPPKTIDMPFCERAASNAFKDCGQIFLSYFSHGCFLLSVPAQKTTSSHLLVIGRRSFPRS